MDDSDSSNRIIVYLKKHNALRTGIFQIVSLPVFVILILAPDMPSGPCTPGLAFLLILYAPSINAVLVLIALGRRIVLGRQHLVPVYINLVALILIIAASIIRIVAFGG